MSDMDLRNKLHMKIYKHTGNGHYIGSCMVVIAFNRDLAEKHIKDLLIKNGLPNEKLNFEEFELKFGQVVVEINGDY